ncbi:hypothetical protein AC578_4540 [Pseudocercospora eumusae]|uniref:Kinetochore protein SPC25 n=1 Tax=Pseudocercospora eumusae TaxID=321146 RepID=A0A139HGF8_9PEZI|nr:hypothetical protein AC578_4540 [Pseudocercospora eumusae]
MAGATMTPSRFGSSMNGSQQAYAATAPSMADTLPTIDFNFDDLRQRMQQFTQRFDEFIERGRKRVLEERNAFRMNAADLEDQQRQRKQAISQFETKSSSHAQILAKEAQETEEMHDAIRSLTAQKEEHTSRRDQLKQEIASVQASIKQRREAQAAHQRSLDAQARENVPELRFWETCLGLRIEGTGIDDTLKFIFDCVDERRIDKECWFELQIGGREYTVSSMKPRLEREDVEGTLERLNESKELGPFLKAMRSLFAEALRS